MIKKIEPNDTYSCGSGRNTKGVTEDRVPTGAEQKTKKFLPPVEVSTGSLFGEPQRYVVTNMGTHPKGRPGKYKITFTLSKPEQEAEEAEGRS